MKQWVKNNIFPFIREDFLRGMPIPGEHPNYTRAFIRWYPFEQIRVDIVAGIIMTFSIIPEVIAFATIAEVPATLCLYGTFWLCLIACLFGGQPGLVSGTSTVLIVIQGNFLRETNGNYDLLFWTLILVGIFQIIFGTFKFSSILHLVSLPVVKGYCSGLALLLLYSQLKGIFAGDYSFPS
jgi:SulP family sulfate permease